MTSPRRAPRALRHASLAVILLAGGAQLGCPSSSETQRAVATPKPPAKPSAPPPEFPARWVLHPSRSLRLRGKIDLGKDGVLYVGQGGERWLDKRNGQAPIAAATLLPESLRGVVAGVDGGLLFVAASGDVYVAGKDPLGATTGKREAPKGLRSITLGRASILGVDRGALMRSGDGGASWSKVALPQTPGTLTYVALTRNGDGLALFSPQRVLATHDDGASWQPLATPGVGARRLVTDTNGDVMLEGLDASAVLRVNPLRLERVNRAPSLDFELPVPADEGALGYADALADGRASIDGTHYAEVVNDPDDSTRWRLAVGELGARPVVRKLAELDGCDGGVVTRRDKTIVVGCQRSPGSSPPSGYDKYRYGGPDRYQMFLFRSEDEGKTFKAEGSVNVADRRKRMWILDGGALLVDGACKSTRGNDWACDDSPPVVRMPGAKAFAKIGVNQPGVQFASLAVSPNGQKVYALGTTSSGRFALYASSDGGKDFTRRMLPPVPAEEPKADPIVTDGVGTSVGVDDAGEVFVVASYGRRWLHYATSDDGASFRARLLPFEANAIGLAGKRGFAFDAAGKGYESLDGGASWTKVAAPQLAAGEDANVECDDYGCLLGSRATRVGWDLKSAADVKPFEEKLEAKKIVSGTPFKCTADGAWVTFEASARPTIYEADFSERARWFAVDRDLVRGTASAIVPSLDAKKGLEAKALAVLGAAGKDSAVYAADYNGAVMALEYTFKRDRPAKPGAWASITPKQTVDVHVAYWHAASGKMVHATLKGAGPLEPSKDLSERRDQPSEARVAFMRFGPGGLYVRPFASATPDSVVYFVSPEGKVEKLSWPELPTKDARGAYMWLSYETARVGKRTLLYGQSTSHGQVLMAWSNEAGTSWETHTWGMWPEIEGAPNDAAIRLLHGAASPTIAVFASGGSAIAPVGWATLLGPGEPDPTTAFALPTQASLGDAPRACDKNGLALPRVVAPYDRGTRHPVLVTLDGSEMLLATNQATLHVNASGDACLGMWEAVPPAWRAGDQYNALVPLDDLGHAWLFKNTNRSSEQQVRTMTCTASKETPIPTTLQNVDGFIQ